MINRLKKKSKKLRTLLAQQFGTEVDYLSTVLGNEDQRKHFKFNKEDKDLQNDNESSKLYSENDKLNKLNDNDKNLNEDERKTYTDSSTFLKGKKNFKSYILNYILFLSLTLKKVHKVRIHIMIIVNTL